MGKTTLASHSRCHNCFWTFWDVLLAALPTLPWMTGWRMKTVNPLLALQTGHGFLVVGQRTRKQILFHSSSRWLPSLTIHFAVVVQSLSRIWLCDPVQHARPPCPSLSPGLCSNSCHWVSDAIEPSHPLQPFSPFTFTLSQHQGLFPRSWLFASVYSTEAFH